MRAKVLFVHTHEARCGVHQYGQNLYSILAPSKRYDFQWCQSHPLADEHQELANRGPSFDWYPDCIIYNWSPNIGGDMARAPFRGVARHHIMVYHDGHINHEAFDAILFSDPTMPQHANWYPIGRPVPSYDPPPMANHPERPRIGVNGFMGAWAILAVRQILHEFKDCVLRLHLPTAAYGDPNGDFAKAQLQACQNLAACCPGVDIEVNRAFMAMEDLLSWLAANDLNVYVRDLPPQWRGVSSVLDAALAVRRPIAVNLCTAFRHVHHCQPSIAIEHNTLRTILANDILPLRPLYEAWAPEVVRGQVEDVLDRIIGIDTHAKGG